MEIDFVWFGPLVERRLRRITPAGAANQQRHTHALYDAATAICGVRAIQVRHTYTHFSPIALNRTRSGFAYQKSCVCVYVLCDSGLRAYGAESLTSNFVRRETLDICLSGCDDASMRTFAATISLGANITLPHTRTPFRKQAFYLVLYSELAAQVEN